MVIVMSVMVDSDDGGGAAGEPATPQHKAATRAARPPGEGTLFRLVQRQAPSRFFLAGEADTK